MGVLSVRRLIDEDFNEGPDGRTRVLQYRVRCSSIYDDRSTISASGMIPAQYSISGGMMLRQRRFERSGKNKRIWRVQCEWDTQVSQNEIERATQADPTARQVTVDIVTIREQVPTFKDRNGRSTTNIIGRPYDPVLMRWRSRLRFECQVNVPYSSGYPGWFFNLADCLNEEPATIRGAEFEEKTLMFIPDRIPDRITEGDYTFYPCRFAVEWTPEGWDQEVLQADVYQRVEGVLRRITEDGVPVTTVRKLDEDGKVIDSDGPDDAFYKTEEIQLLGDFSVLEDFLA